jgi:hypothetical protein
VQRTSSRLFLGVSAAGCLVACSSGSPHVALDGGFDAGFGPSPYIDGGPPLDASWTKSDSGFVVPDAGTIAKDRFVTNVVSVSLGPCSGFGRDQMPAVVEGPPIGGGACSGGTNVLSLGNGGEIVVSFEPNWIVDGPGPDFIVFENAFYVHCDESDGSDAEPAEVSVSDDGVTWTSFPCTNTTAEPPFQQCAGVHPVFANPTNGISPVDPKTAGGDLYDLADIGLTKAKYVRIVDKVIEACPDSGAHLNTNGFDLDAIAIVNGGIP